MVQQVVARVLGAPRPHHLRVRLLVLAHRHTDTHTPRGASSHNLSTLMTLLFFVSFSENVFSKDLRAVDDVADLGHHLLQLLLQHLGRRVRLHNTLVELHTQPANENEIIHCRKSGYHRHGCHPFRGGGTYICDLGDQVVAGLLGLLLLLDLVLHGVPVLAQVVGHALSIAPRHILGDALHIHSPRVEYPGLSSGPSSDDISHETKL